LHSGVPSSRDARRVRRTGVLSLAKLASTDQRYYLDQAGGRLDHAGSVPRGMEDYYLGGPEAAGRWTGSAARLLGLGGTVSEAPLRGVLSQARSAVGREARGAGGACKGAGVRPDALDPLASIHRSSRSLGAGALNWLGGAG
jgi:hypothetical protein